MIKDNSEFNKKHGIEKESGWYQCGFYDAFVKMQSYNPGPADRWFPHNEYARGWIFGNRKRKERMNDDLNNANHTDINLR